MNDEQAEGKDTQDRPAAPLPPAEVSGQDPVGSTTADGPSVSLAGAERGIGRGIAAGLSGESVSVKGVLEAIGGVRGVFESLLPGLLYLIVYVVTQDPQISVIAPAVLAIGATSWRFAKREPATPALAGLFGVGICVVTTLVTGKGEDYFLPGFWINGAWSIALLGSLVVGWPLIGFIVGALRGELTAWRKDRIIRRAAALCTASWLLLFLVRLAVQLPLYYASETAALGVARLVMGVPLYGLLVLFTWLLMRSALAKQNPVNEDV
jgi:hypothetical protein